MFNTLTLTGRILATISIRTRYTISIRTLVIHWRKSAILWRQCARAETHTLRPETLNVDW